MSRVPLHYINLRTFCHETEDQKRVEGALWTFPPDELDVDHVESAGHYDDRTIVFSAHVERANDARYVLDKIRDLPDFETLLDEFDQRVMDNTEFPLWLDRQAASKGEVRRGGGLIFRAEVEAYPAKKEAVVESVRDTLLGDE